MVDIPLTQLRAHPLNSNVMGRAALTKLTRHIQKTGKYPPLIVRPAGEPGCFEVLDGHHRWKALQKLQVATASCEVWEVDDQAALLLLGTLNRLRGEDDPHKRAALLNALANSSQGKLPAQLAKLLPDTLARIRKCMQLAKPPPKPRKELFTDDTPIAVYFFLNAAQRTVLDSALHAIGGQREAALMKLVEQQRTQPT